jgi:gas vesicle protein
MKGKRILGGFIVGAMIGAIISLFATPYSGKDTRKKIKERTKKIIK